MKSFKKILFTTIFFILILFMANEVNATTINVSSSSVKVGQSVTITVSVPNVNTVDLTANISGAGTSGSIRIVDGSMTGEAKTFSKSTTVTPTSEGTITITVSSSSNAVLNGQYVNVSASKSITVTKPATDNGSSNTGGSITGGNTGSSTTGNTNENKKSNVATLSNLGISPNDFSGFKPGKYNYSVTVENAVQQVTVYASTTHNKASWSVSGANVAGVNGKTVKLKEGTNNIYVTVKAEDGTTKKYTIAVTRKAATGEIIPNVIEDQEFEQVGVTEGLGLKTLIVEGLKISPEFKIDTYEYEILIENEEISTLEELKNLLTYEANFENPLIEIQSENEEFKEGENLVYIIVKDTEREVAKYTLKIMLPEEEEIVAEIKDMVTEKEEEPILSKEMLILIGSISLLTIIGIVAIIRLYMVSQRLAVYENKIEFKDVKQANNSEEENSEVPEYNPDEYSEGRRAARRKGGKHRER